MPKLLMRLRFNGATTSRSWIRKVYLLFEKHCELFQWGHNLSVMDTAQMVRDGAAFTYRFQWGHNLSVMDTRVWNLIVSLQSTGFNGATTSRSWIQRYAGAKLRRYIVSMGPQPLGHGYVRLDSKINGATTVKS